MSLSDELAWRGFIKDKTFSNSRWLDKPQILYHGVDGSADSLTVGNLAALMMARHFIQAGWRAVLLVGGATSLVGDPGGKDSERPLPSREQVAKNVAAIQKQLEKFFADQKITIVNNLDWLGGLKLVDFLRDIGKQYSMSELIQREFVSERIGQGGSGLSYAEFSYSLIQGYDFWHLHKKHSVSLQIGGSDQWSNMLSGVSLVRKLEAKEVHALSMPLIINQATGAKFGKTEGGAIWLDASKTSPTQFYQFWMNVDDTDVEDYLRIFTFLPKEEVAQIMSRQKAHKHARPAQQALAQNVTKLVHGSQATGFAEAVTDFLTGKSDVAKADEAALKEIRQAIPSLSIQPGSSLIETLVQSNLVNSNSEARRLIQEGATYLNNQPFNQPHLETSDFQNGRAILRRGKAFKDSVLIELI
jgi:tyrosyl-tRNA synthetase